MKKFLLLSVAAALSLSACSRREIVRPAPPLTFVIMPGGEATQHSMDVMEGMLTDYGYVVVDRSVLSAIFNGLQVPESGPLTPVQAAEIARRSGAQMLITLNWRKNTDDLAYENGAYSLRMRWISLPDGKISVSRTKTLYFMLHGGPEVKQLMKSCLEAYRAAHPKNQ